METETITRNGKKWTFRLDVWLGGDGYLNVDYTRTSPSGSVVRGRVGIGEDEDALAAAIRASFRGRGRNGQLETWIDSNGDTVVEGFGVIAGEEDADFLSALQSIQDLMEMEGRPVASLRWLREHVKKGHADYHGRVIDYSIGRYRVDGGAGWVEPLHESA